MSKVIQNPNNDPKKAPKQEPTDPRVPEFPPKKETPNPQPEWVPKDPPVQEPPAPKVPEIEPPPTEDPSQDPGTPPPNMG